MSSLEFTMQSLKASRLSPTRAVAGLFLLLLSLIVLVNESFAAELGGDRLTVDDSKPAGTSTRFTTLFDSDSRWLVPAKNFNKWRAMTDRAAVLGPPRHQAWTSMISRLSYVSPREKIRGVQLAINILIYDTDSNIWGIDDYWAAPAELFRQGRGDNEDIAIAKYFALRALGFRAEDLRILIAQDGNNAPDSVLLVAVPGDILQLSWFTNNVTSFERRRSHVELYSLNEDYVWLHQRRLEVLDLNLDGKVMEAPAVGSEPVR